MPTVSVIIPTHNRADSLHKAIHSVLNQTYRDFEIVVVDDASTDNTQDVVSGFNDKRIKYKRHENNKGDAGSRNTGILNSAGEYVAFLDDDDEWLPEKLELQVAVLGNSSPKLAGVYAGSLNIEPSSGRIIGIKIPDNKEGTFQEMLWDNFIATSCVLLKRECFERVGLFDENIPYNSDYDMWLRIAEYYNFESIKEPLVIYQTYGRKLGTNLRLVIEGLEMVLVKYGGFFAKDRRNMSRWYYTLGVLYALEGDAEQSRRSLFRAIGFSPFMAKNYCILLVSGMGMRALKRFIQIKETITEPLRMRRICEEVEKVADGSLSATAKLICRTGRDLRYGAR